MATLPLADTPEESTHQETAGVDFNGTEIAQDVALVPLVPFTPSSAKHIAVPPD